MNFVYPHRYKSAGASLTDFVTEWTVGASDMVTLPLDSGNVYNFTIDWGDGTPIQTVSTHNDPNATHEYISGGVFEQRISGVCEGYQVDNDATIDTKITDVIQWGNIGIVEINFYGCSNFPTTLTATDIPNLTLCISIFRIFKNCGSLEIIPNINSWDVSNVEDFTEVFFALSNFNTLLDNWITSSATTMLGMFRGCVTFDQSVDSFDVSNVTIFGDMFKSCTIYDQSMGSWITSSATKMSSMFESASSFNQSVDHFDVSGVTTFLSMFFGATIYNQSMNSWTLNSTGSISMQNMFLNAAAFNGNITSWNTTEVTNMFNMIRNCDSFNQNIGGWNVGKVTTMSFMFQGSAIFNQSLNSWDINKVNNFSSMFESTGVYNQPMNNWVINTTIGAGVVFTNMFRFNNSFNQDISGWDTSEVINMGGMFNDADAFNQNLPNWNVEKVTSFGAMFANNSAFNGTLTNWNTLSLTGAGMVAMFQEATSFDQPVDHFDVSACSNFLAVFEAMSFNKDLSSWDMISATNLERMFAGNGTFNQDISSWDISSVADMSQFANAGSFDTTNYDLMLIAFDLLTLQSGVTWEMGSTQYTKTQVDSGTTDGVSANKLIESGQNFLTTVSINDVVHNTTDDTYAVVTAVDSDTQLSIDVDIMISGENYNIETSLAAKAKADMIINDNWVINDGGGV